MTPRGDTLVASQARTRHAVSAGHLVTMETAPLGQATDCPQQGRGQHWPHSLRLTIKELMNEIDRKFSPSFPLFLSLSR